jgi:hypothetical protein
MRQALFAMLLILAYVCPGSSFSMAQQVPPSTSDQSLPEMGMVVGQRKTENKLDKQSNDEYQDKHRTYKCFDNCIESRAQCEQYAVTQKNKEIGMVGSKENNEWSRDCQMIYMICQNKCKE